jgi:hypothetical protein
MKELCCVISMIEHDRVSSLDRKSWWLSSRHSHEHWKNNRHSQTKYYLHLINLSIDFQLVHIQIENENENCVLKLFFLLLRLCICGDRIKSPEITVKFRYENKSVEASALLDTGAEICSMPQSKLLEWGLDNSKAIKKGKLFTFGGKSINVLIYK